jgi:general stress protein YciG
LEVNAMSLSNTPMTTSEFLPDPLAKPAEAEKAPPPAEANAEPPPAPPRPKARRGFAVMDRARVRDIARKGGVSAHAKGTAHEFSAEEARTAGRKGGLATHRRRGPKPKATPPEGSPPA